MVIGILSTSSISAQEISNYPPIVQEIVTNYNLNISSLDDVFDEKRNERRANMYAVFAEDLNDFVIEGKLTETQKEAILEKYEEMQNKLEDVNGLNLKQKREKAREIHQEFRSWIEKNNTNLPIFRIIR